MNDSQTPAALAYRRSSIRWAGMYVGFVFTLSFLRNAHLLVEPWNWVVAWLPAVPIAGFMWAFLEFTRDSDEYVRALTTKRLIAALFVTQVICSVWGFLEVYAGAPHIELYLVVPIFWASYGVVCPCIRTSL